MRGFILNSTSGECDVDESEKSRSGAKIFKFGKTEFKVVFGICAGLALVAKLIDGSPKRNDLAVMHIMQQIMLLPLISKSIPTQVQDMIAFSGFPVRTLNTMSKNIIINTRLIENLSFDQNDAYLSKLDLESGSTIINNLALALILMFLGALNIQVVILHILNQGQNNCF